MHQIRRDQVDERIQDFLSKKATKRNLSQVIADWFIDTNRPEERPRRGSGYELLPLKSTRYSSR